MYFLNQQLPVASNPLEIIKPRSDVRVPNQAEVKPEPSEATTEQPASPKFEFYNVLPELEVVLPEGKKVQSLPETVVEKGKPKVNAVAAKVIEAAPIVKAKEAVVEVKSSLAAHYFQVGSFKQREDAERRQVELILLGLEAKIQSARIKGATWYRVRLGPYGGSAEIARIKTKLRKNRVDFLLIKG
ncbi:MAG: SPOR domain-containing protein [Gammaproteobacteria bacterium]|nr:SPOR domain-containing protein [Gammaproteobacteria bacterium]